MISDLTNRTVMLSGASSGIGAHLARVLAKAGANVVLGARRAERTEALASEIKDAGGRSLAVSLDVTAEASVAAAYNTAEAEFGIVDTVIANAGIAANGRSTDVPIQDLRSVLDTNFLGVYLLAREGAKRMIVASPSDASQGRIVLIGSITAQMNAPGDAAYAASKAGVAHLGRLFAREWVRKGVNVNTIQPGYIRTEIMGDWFDTEGGERQITGWHRKRLMDIDALDDLTLYLCSDASRYITGGTFTVDDGQSL